MQPFFNSTRASMISCPTTNWRCSSGLRSSSGMACQGMYCRTADARLGTARLARAGRFVLERGVDFDFDFVFAMIYIHRLQSCAVLPGLSSNSDGPTARLEAAPFQDKDAKRVYSTLSALVLRTTSPPC